VPVVTRAIVLWCPDWPVTAAVQAFELAADAPIALVDRNLVFACSAPARADGVKRGLRIREAQARCTALQVFPYDPALDARAFEPVLAAIEELTPGVQLVRPGTCVLRARGPARYYGGEERAAAELLRCLEGLGIPDARIGIADGPFAAEQAARSTGADRVRVIPPGDSPAFLAPLPVAMLGREELTPLFRRLGIHRLGDLAALDRTDVRERFGELGAHCHTLASGLDGAAVVPRTPPKQLDRVIEFEPPLDRVDQVTFAFRATAETFIAGLTKAGLVCTSLRIEVTDERGRMSERTWLHPRLFSAADVVDRVRWQLQGSGAIDSGLGSPIMRVLVAPEAVDDIGHHEDGLWGGGADERIHHGLSRVQSMLGHDAVLTATIGGGRALAERQVLVPWGDRAVGVARAAQPWPGSLPAPAPATVFEAPLAVAVLAEGGDQVTVDERGSVTSPIARFSPTGTTRDAREVTAWAGPWPVRERWWDASLARTVQRFQVVDADGTAWLLALDGTEWRAEARYD
jgi:protein ImuB